MLLETPWHFFICEPLPIQEISESSAYSTLFWWTVGVSVGLVLIYYFGLTGSSIHLISRRNANLFWGLFLSGLLVAALFVPWIYYDSHMNDWIRYGEEAMFATEKTAKEKYQDRMWCYVWMLFGYAAVLYVGLSLLIGRLIKRGTTNGIGIPDLPPFSSK